MQKFRLRLLAVMLGMIPIATDAIADRAIPEDNLAYPVLIVFPGGTGSGFYLNANNAMYLVTAKHVLFYVDPISKKEKLRDGPVNALSYSKDRADSRRNILNLNLAALNAAGYIKSHATEDVAVIKVATILSQPVTDSPQQLKVEVLPRRMDCRRCSRVPFLSYSVLHSKRWQQVSLGLTYRRASKPLIKLASAMKW
jgi:hypothetical protein